MNRLTKICSLFLALAMLCTMQSVTMFAQTANISASQAEEGESNELAQAKSDAKKELAVYKASQKASRKAEDKVLWDWTIWDKGKAIDSAQDKNAVQTNVDSAKVQIDKIISGEYEKELGDTYERKVRTVKSEMAIAELDEYMAKYNENDYFASDWKTLKSFESAARSNIKNAVKSVIIASDAKEAIKAIDVFLEGVKKDVASVPDKTDPAAIALEKMKQDLEAYKEAAIAEINNNYTAKLGNYPNQMQYSQLKKIIDDGIANIKRVEVAEGENVSSGNLGIYTKRVDILLAQIKANLEDKMSLYDSANLVPVKTKARKELESYKNPKNYREAQKKELEDAVAAGKKAINNAKTKEEVAKALKDAKAQIDRIKTDAQLKKEKAAQASPAKTSNSKNKAQKASPAKTSISKIKAQKKGFTVKWKKQTKDVGGYEVSYSTNKRFTKKTTVTKRITKKTSTKLTVKKLKAKKKYYVRVRTYKTVNGKKYVSNWSSAKTVVTKK